MKIKLIEEKDNRLLHRKEVAYEVTFDAATPSKEELQNQIGAQQKVDPELVETKGIYTKFV